jgi:hypothetical protein
MNEGKLRETANRPAPSNNSLLLEVHLNNSSMAIVFSRALKGICLRKRCLYSPNSLKHCTFWLSDNCVVDVRFFRSVTQKLSSLAFWGAQLAIPLLQISCLSVEWGYKSLRSPKCPKFNYRGTPNQAFIPLRLSR